MSISEAVIVRGTHLTCYLNVFLFFPQLEQEIQRISEAYDTLMKGCAKRETLEQALRNKLMAEIKRLQQSSIQAAKEAEAADQNQHVIEKLLLQSEFMNTATLNLITVSHALETS